MVPVRREILQRFVWWGAQTYKFPQLNGTISSLACEESLSNLAILPILRRCWRISPLLVHVKSWKNCGRIYLTWFVSSVWTERKYWTVPYERRVESNSQIFQPVESSSSASFECSRTTGQPRTYRTPLSHCSLLGFATRTLKAKVKENIDSL